MKKPCKNCGEPVEQVPGRKEKKYCSSSCRVLACLKRKNGTGKKAKPKEASKPAKVTKKKEKIAYKKTTKKSMDGSKLYRKVLEVRVSDTGNNIVVQDLTKPTNQVTPITDPKQVKNAVISLKPKQSSSGSMSFLEKRRQDKLK